MTDKKRIRDGKGITERGRRLHVEEGDSSPSHSDRSLDDEVQIDTLTANQIPEAADILARSFSNDPNHCDLFPNEETRTRVLRHEFSAACRAVLDLGHIYTASCGGTLCGVAVWVPPGEFPFSLRRKLRTVPDLIRILAVAPGSARRLQQLATDLEELLPAQPYWYLLAVGVKPEAQGRGIGTKLLSPVLAHADKAEQPCYLETANERNVAWYRDLGFDVRDAEVSVTSGGPPNWIMLRQPREE